MKKIYIKPSIEVVGVKTTPLLAGSFDNELRSDDVVSSEADILSTRYLNYDVWGDDEE